MVANRQTKSQPRNRKEILILLSEILEGRLRYHELKMQPEVETDSRWEPWNDENYLLFDVGSKELISDAVRFLAKRNPYNPVKEFLESLRCEAFQGSLSDALFGRSDELDEILLRRWLIGAVARVLSPGCKMDTVLVLLGSQGIGKSSLFRTLGGEWFTDSLSSGRNLEKDDLLILHQHWIAEWSELGRVLTPEKTEQVKAFLSRQEDVFRPPYGRNPIRLPRKFVLCASTNQSECLPDRTGNRRYWLIETDFINLEYAKATRDQIWMWAVLAYKNGEQWWLTALEEQLLRERHKNYLAGSELLGNLETLMADRLEASTGEILKWLGMSGKKAEREIADALRTLGWKQTIKKEAGKSTRVWVKA